MTFFPLGPPFLYRIDVYQDERDSFHVKSIAKYVAGTC